jgi:hypothetical protein
MLVSATLFLAALIGLQGILVVKLADRLTGTAAGGAQEAAPAHGRFANVG